METVGYFCNHCGYSPDNRCDWCDLGCGDDYNEMIRVPKRLIDKLAAQPNVQADFCRCDAVGDKCVFCGKSR